MSYYDKILTYDSGVAYVSCDYVTEWTVSMSKYENVYVIDHKTR